MCAARMQSPATGQRPRPRLSLGSRTLPPMGASASVGSKWASFDWPPPPSPASGKRQAARAAPVTMAPHRTNNLGATQRGGVGPGDGPVAATSVPDLAAGADLEYRLASRPAEIRARAELWAVRAEIDQEKLRLVAPFPFFGRTMRFQDDFAALQITSDGRFSFSDVFVEGGQQAADQVEMEAEATGDGRAERRRVVTYEGVFAAPHASSVEVDESQEQQTAPPPHSDPEVASIEGRAIVRFEVEEHNGRTRLTSVTRGSYRFAITVNPFFQPDSATVQPVVRPRSPGHPPARTRRLPYVGVGIPARPSRMPYGRGDTGKLRRKALHMTKEGLDGTMLKTGALPGLGMSNSAPQLPTLSATASLGQDNHQPTDWHEHYRLRAEKAMARADGR